MDFPTYLIHWNAPEWCAESVQSLLGSEGVATAITVVDNSAGDSDRLRHLLPSLVRIIPMSRNLGYTGGANAALADWRDRYPASKFSVIGSHDLHVRPDCLARLVEWAHREPGLGVLAPTLIAPFPTSGGTWGRAGARHLPIGDSPGLADRDWASGTCLFIRRACADQVGGFDERFGSYVEDVDFCLRVKDHGWRIGVVREAIAWGLGTASREAWPMMEANGILLMAKRDGFVGASRGALRLAAWAARSGAGSIAPWRRPEQRKESAAFFRRHKRALARIPLKTIFHAARERQGHPTTSH